MEIKAFRTRIFQENEALLQFVLKYIKKLPENSVLVMASKIVALSEGRTASYKNAKSKMRERTALIKRESEFALNTKVVWLTIKDGMIMANAGIDESNGAGKLIFLPRDSFKTAEMLCKQLKKHFKIKNLGVVISDSGLLPLRAGVIGVAVGYAGFEGVKSYKNKRDIFGRKFAYQKTNIADSLATTAALCMGEGDEQQPLAIIENAPVVFKAKINKKEIQINPKEDIYAPLLNKFN